MRLVIRWSRMPRYISQVHAISPAVCRAWLSCSKLVARHDPAVISEVDGMVEFGKTVRGQQQVIVKGEEEETREYLVPHGKHMMVHDSDYVHAGDRLCEGSVDPHDILRDSRSRMPCRNTW